MDVAFTDGTIAVKERYLLKDKLLRMCETGAEEAFRMLKESGFGSGAAQTVGEYEKLVAADGVETDAFVREYAPTNAEKAYLLSPRDFHNAKALVKAEFLQKDPAPMLAPEGLVTIDRLKKAVYNGDYTEISSELRGAVSRAKDYLSAEGAAVKDGAEVGGIFLKAEYDFLKRTCYRNALLKRLITAQADMTNLLTLYRSGIAAESDGVEKLLVGGGSLDKKQLFAALGGGKEMESGGGYEEFIGLLSSPKGVSAAENYRDSYPIKYLADNKYELKAAQPFMYYVLRRRAENADVRIIFACLLNGVGEREIKARLRGERAWV